MRWLAFVLLFGCGDNLGVITAEDRQAAETAARCERLTRCGEFADRASCEAYFRPRDQQALAAAIAAGIVRYDPIAERICLRNLAAASCDSTAMDVRSLSTACEGVLVGTRATAAACMFDDECLAGRCEAPACPRSSCCAGVCKPMTKPIGGECASNDDCDAPAYCNAGHICQPLESTGGPCMNDGSCEYGLGCVGATTLQAGSCRKLPAIGERCPYGRCAEIGARCDAGTCVAVRLPGAPCTADAQCSEYASCDEASGVCVDTPTLGMPCELLCGGAAFCDATGTCVTPRENGAECGADNECASQFCAEGPIYDFCATAATCY